MKAKLASLTAVAGGSLIAVSMLFAGPASAAPNRWFDWDKSRHQREQRLAAQRGWKHREQHLEQLKQCIAVLESADQQRR
jgi:hypothetical protein